MTTLMFLSTCLLLINLGPAVRAAALDPIIIPLQLESGLLFANFDIGSSKNLSMSIATGYEYAILNPGIYQGSTTNPLAVANISAQHFFGKQCGTLDVGYVWLSDTISTHDLVAQEQTFIDITPNPAANDSVITKYPHDGVVGLTGNVTSGLGKSFVQNLCDQGQFKECRFGLIVDNIGAGTLVMGGFDGSMTEGPHDQLQVATNSAWISPGQVSFIVGLETRTFLAETFLLKSEITDIIGPIQHVREILNSITGAVVEEEHTDCGRMIRGTFPCNATLPILGFTFGIGGLHDLSGPTWQLDPSLWNVTSDGITCTAPIVGWEDVDTKETWYLGQAFFRGKYVDFDLGKSIITVAQTNLNGSTVGERGRAAWE